MSIRALGLLLLGMLQAGCTTGLEYRPPAITLPAQWHETVPAAAAAPAPDEWWQDWLDPVLDRLMARAARDNLDLARARAMLRAARAEHGIIEASQYPHGALLASAARAHESANVPHTAQGLPGETDTLFQVGFDAGWEIDLFGARRRQREASAAELGATEDDTAAVRLSVLAEVARNYIDLRGIEAQIALTQQSMSTAEQARTLMQSRLVAGIGTESELAAATASLALIQAAIEPNHAARQRALHRLAVLSGRPPGAIERELEAGQAMAAAPVTLPDDLPSSLLRQRPDIRAAERRLAAATARVGAAQADWYPRFSLVGEVGLASAALGRLSTGASRTWSIGPSFSWPILRAGQISAMVSVRDAEQQAALIAYRQAILTAMEEVENALASYRHEQARHAQLAKAVTAHRDRLTLAQSHFEGGLSDFRLVLAMRQPLIEAQQALTRSVSALAMDWIALHKALGGNRANATGSDVTAALADKASKGGDACIGSR